MSKNMLIGLGVGIAIGIGVGYLIVQWRQATLRQPPPPPPGSLTTFTRDEQGRIVEIMEKPLCQVYAGRS